jgi:hypothetical protein
MECYANIGAIGTIISWYQIGNLGWFDRAGAQNLHGMNQISCKGFQMFHENIALSVTDKDAAKLLFVTVVGAGFVSSRNGLAHRSDGFQVEQSTLPSSHTSEVFHESARALQVDQNCALETGDCPKLSRRLKIAITNANYSIKAWEHEKEQDCRWEFELRRTAHEWPA